MIGRSGLYEDWYKVRASAAWTCIFTQTICFNGYIIVFKMCIQRIVRTWWWRHADVVRDPCSPVVKQSRKMVIDQSEGFFQGSQNIIYGWKASILHTAHAIVKSQSLAGARNMGNLNSIVNSDLKASLGTQSVQLRINIENNNTNVIYTFPYYENITVNKYR